MCRRGQKDLTWTAAVSEERYNGWLSVGTWEWELYGGWGSFTNDGEGIYDMRSSGCCP